MGIGIGGPVFWFRCDGCGALGVGPTIALAHGDLVQATERGVAS
jgi:hypothetical protein